MRCRKALLHSFLSRSPSTPRSNSSRVTEAHLGLANSSIGAAFRRLISPFRQFGLFAGLLYAIDRTVVQFSPSIRLRYYEIMCQPIANKSLLPGCVANELEIREIKRGDPEVDLMPARPEIKESRFEQGAVCLGAFRRDRLVGYIWFCRRRYEEDEVRCTFMPIPEREAVFDFDLYIFPPYRLGRAFAGIWQGANEYLWQHGIRHTFSRVTRYNLSSRRAHKHLGAKVIGRSVFLLAGSLQLMLATIFPYAHLSMKKSGRVRLALRPGGSLR
jgi:hypothetical protein